MSTRTLATRFQTMSDCKKDRTENENSLPVASSEEEFNWKVEESFVTEKR